MSALAGPTITFTWQNECFFPSRQANPASDSVTEIVAANVVRVPNMTRFGPVNSAPTLCRTLVGHNNQGQTPNTKIETDARHSVSNLCITIAWATKDENVSGAGEGNRTLVISLEGCCSTIELHPQTFSCEMVEDVGFEPT